MAKNDMTCLDALFVALLVYLLWKNVVAAHEKAARGEK